MGEAERGFILILVLIVGVGGMSFGMTFTSNGYSTYFEDEGFCEALYEEKYGGQAYHDIDETVLGECAVKFTEIQESYIRFSELRSSK